MDSLNPAHRFALAAGLAAAVVMTPGWGGAATLSGSALTWPSADELLRVLSFRDYNTRVVIIGTTLLGLAAGLVGTFLLLRKRALLSDAISHATLPGIALAFIVMTALWGDGKHLFGLIGGAAIFSILGTAAVVFIQKTTRLKDDAALGIVLSVFFGFGIALMGLATRMAAGNAAGLNAFIYGKTASMLFFDALIIAITALAAIIFCLLFFKEFTLICFDAGYAAAQGWPVTHLDFLLMALVVVVTVIGLQAVGLILVVALLIIPAAAARFWTFRLFHMLALSGLFGALSGMLGAAVSALMASLPAGAVIVLTASCFFLFSMAFGAERGLYRRFAERRRLRRKIVKENLLRELFEWQESSRQPAGTSRGLTLEELRFRRSWETGPLRRAVDKLAASGELGLDASGRIRLSDKGRGTARDIVRKHRLWEAYLITHADVATGMVDLSADRIEHVLDREIITGLEALFPETAGGEIPLSPHVIGQPSKGATS